jgi:hypothetical protein
MHSQSFAGLGGLKKELLARHKTTGDFLDICSIRFCFMRPRAQKALAKMVSDYGGFNYKEAVKYYTNEEIYKNVLKKRRKAIIAAIGPHNLIDILEKEYGVKTFFTGNALADVLLFAEHFKELDATQKNNGPLNLLSD